jgi:phenylpyruvate tautomerase PptA (4-oxalocrotonate tautomerase family)
MPYLQLDIYRPLSGDQKKALAKRFGQIYSEHMQASIRRISVAIRELEDGVWRCTEEEPYRAALLMCDIRSGRPAHQRARLAEALVAACIELLDLKIEQINVEFTQHSGDEMYHPLLGGLSEDWSPDEASQR